MSDWIGGLERVSKTNGPSTPKKTTTQSLFTEGLEHVDLTPIVDDSKQIKDFKKFAKVVDYERNKKKTLDLIGEKQKEINSAFSDSSAKVHSRSEIGPNGEVLTGKERLKNKLNNDSNLKKIIREKVSERKKASSSSKTAEEVAEDISKATKGVAGEVTEAKGFFKSVGKHKGKLGIAAAVVGTAVAMNAITPKYDIPLDNLPASQRKQKLQDLMEIQKNMQSGVY